MKSWETRVNEFLRMPVLQHCRGIQLFVMGKILNTNNYQNWIKKRRQVFCAQLSIVDAADSTIYSTADSKLKPYEKMGMVFCNLQPVRRVIVQMMIQRSNQETTTSELFRTVLKYLKWTEMGHIGFINKYIFRYHPHLIHMRELRSLLNTPIFKIHVIPIETGKTIR